MNRKCFKFVTPQVASSGEKDSEPVRKGNSPQKKKMLITADIHTPGSVVSQGVTLENLLGENIQADTPVLKKLMLGRMQKSKPNALQIEQKVTQMCKSNLPKEHIDKHSIDPYPSMESKETKIPEPNTAKDRDRKVSIYVFPTSPKGKKESRNLVSQTHVSSKKSLLRYIFATLREIEEIRAKRKILKQQGLAGFKRFKSSKSFC